MVSTAAALGGVRRRRIAPVVLVGEVDHTVGIGGTLAECVEVVEVTAEHGHALRLQRRRRRVGAGEPEHVVTCGEQLVDGRRTDPP